MLKTFILFSFFSVKRTIITPKARGSHTAWAEHKNMTFHKINRQNSHSVEERGRLYTPHRAIKATRWKVEDNLFLYKESKKKNKTKKKKKKKTSTIKTHYRDSSNPRGKHIRTHL